MALFFFLFVLTLLGIGTSTILKNAHTTQLTLIQRLIVSIPPLLVIFGAFVTLVLFAPDPGSFSDERFPTTMDTIFDVIGVVIILIGVFFVFFASPFVAIEAALFDLRKAKIAKLPKGLQRLFGPGTTTARRMRGIGLIAIMLGLLQMI